MKLHAVETLKQGLCIDQSVDEKDPNEPPILVPERIELTDGQVVGFQTEPGTAARVLVLYSNRSSPAGG